MTAPFPTASLAAELGSPLILALPKGRIHHLQVEWFDMWCKIQQLAQRQARKFRPGEHTTA